MQPKFTQKAFMPIFSCLVVVALVSFLSVSVQAQTKGNRTATGEKVQNPKELLYQKQQLELKSNNDMGIVETRTPASAENANRGSKAIANRTEAVCATFTGSLGAGDLTMPQRLNRPGGAPSGNCAGGWVFPGTFGTGPYYYDVHTYTNNTGSTQCGTFTLSSTDVTNANIAFGIWNGSFDPNNMAANSIAAPNVSTGTPAANIVLNVTINAGQTIVIPVWSANVNSSPAGTASNYTVTVEFPTCAPCVPVAAEAPIISPLPASVCAGSSVTLSVIGGNLNGAANWKWYTGSCGGTLVGTGSSITVSPAATTTYYVRGEDGCAPAPGPCATRVVTVSACTCVSPESATICAGQIQRLKVSGTGAPASSTTPSGAITVSIPDASATGATHAIPVALPAGATITSMSVNFNITHTWDADLVINLRAPNGNVLNLVNQRGGSGDNFTNTTISSASATSLATGAPPFTGTFAADAALGQGPTGNVSNVNNWAALYTGVVSGNWTLAMRDLAGGDVGTLTSWSITINYTADPTATWTGPAGTIFSDPAATVPYVAGTQANTVYVQPTATSTYTANSIVGGPCAGQTINIPITVNPLPTVAVSPNPGGCAPVTLTASGATVYTWSPSAGLSATTGASVVATPSTNTVYTVTGVSATTGCSNTTTVSVNGTSTAAVISAPPAFISLVSEGFNSVEPTLPAGWAAQNLSAPVGITGWFQGNAGVFPSQSGAPTAYIGANFNNTAGTGTISNWLFAPNVTLQNGDEIEFWTRKVSPDAFPDRLELRWSANGASTNAGATATSVGDFTTLLLSVNPSLITGVYPTSWTKFTATVSGLAGPTSGRVAFRYFVTNGGPSGANSDYIGIDEFSIRRPLSGVCPNTVSTISVNITGGVSPYTLVYTNGTTNYTFNGYTSGTPIQVTPAVTTGYTIVSVTGANGCPGVGNTGVATINVVQPPAITSQPSTTTVCAGGNATFSVGATPAIATTTFQWQVSTNGGVTWTNLTNVAPYSGVTLSTLTITGVTAGMHNNRYRVIVGGQCPPQPLTSSAAVLNVNVPPAITTNPTSISRCLGTSASFTAAASVSSGNASFSYQWQVSVDGGVTFSNISGATSATYTIASVTQAMNGNRYRCVVTVAPCATTATTTAATLTVIPLPNVTISSPVTQLVPGRTTTITASSTPAAAAGGWSWTLNGGSIPGTTNTQTVNIDGVGSYQATVTDVNGCVNKSNVLVIGTEASDRLWIYPNPTTGQFQVRLYYGSDVAEKRAVHIYDELGQIIMTKEFNLVTETPDYLQMDFDLSKQARGVYVVKVVHKYSGKIVSGLVIKQ
ncbi:MAG TPA: choice-of-anchor J domain-containing protein [Chitinophagaceae bacterium]|nr:choice-of-anchor J domain-containing protein [Chitinophagaceae bacterium]